MVSQCYIIVVNYNSCDFTIQCIESLYNLNNKAFKILLVDNNSSDKSLELLNDKFSSYDNFEMISSISNNGYASGINQGIDYALKQNDCKYIWILNNDTKVYENTLDELIISDNSTSKKTIWGSKIINSNKTIQSIGCRLNKMFMTTSHNYKDCKDSKENYRVSQLDYIHGCSMFFKNDIIKINGFFDENYFLFYEDVDYSISAKNKNISLDVSQKSIVTHYGGKTIEKNNLSYYSTINRIKFCKKYYREMLLFVYLGIFFELIKCFFLFRFKRIYKILINLFK